MSDGKPGEPLPFNCAQQGAASWRARAEAAARLLRGAWPGAAAPRALADVGCGDGKLAAALRAAGCAAIYAGYDLHPQAPAVQRFDLRTEVLPPGHDVAVLLGVVEYLPDLPAVLRRLARSVPRCLLSHVVAERSTYTAERLAELGWCNHLPSDALVALLAANGWSEVAREWTPDGRTLLLACQRTAEAT